MFDRSDTRSDHHTTAHRLPQAEQAVLRLLEADWRQMCSGTEIPVHAQLDPHALHDALPHAFLLHRTAPSAVRIRVAGQRLHDLLRIDPRGMSFGTFFTAAARDVAMNIVESAFDAPAIVGLPLTAARGLGRQPMKAELLLLPMRDAAGQTTRMMGALVAAGPLGNRSYRFDIAEDATLRFDDLDLPFADRRSHRARPVPGQRPMLRLVVNNG
ncbi:PAS domain-containing protein [Loktanella sp. M215]|uniref:PAS domain-containing protein n=1 Tax=Loktanella sp. M215 TaxID=2675431 RepID=UPI001F3900CD|nr:PAS domain-containing protein [Loktanella sp. M215]MCF7700610.1 PAS domain-containing protein [Loktanella sp. M215]